MSRPTDAGRTFAELACHLLQSGVAGSPSQAAAMACDLAKISRGYHRIAERECNEPLPDGYAERTRNRLAKAIGKIATNNGGLNLSFKVKTDPRAGFGLLLRFLDGRTNDFGQEGIIVPCKVTD